MKRRIISEVWYTATKDERNDCILNFIKKEVNIVDSENNQRKLKLFISSLSTKISAKWEKSNRMLSRFLTENEAWLEGEVSLPSQCINLPSRSLTELPKKDVADLKSHFMTVQKK